jgi:hypothetical protein
MSDYDSWLEGREGVYAELCDCEAVECACVLDEFEPSEDRSYDDEN